MDLSDFAPLISYSFQCSWRPMVDHSILLSFSSPLWASYRYTSPQWWFWKVILLVKLCRGFLWLKTCFSGNNGWWFGLFFCSFLTLHWWVALSPSVHIVCLLLKQYLITFWMTLHSSSTIQTHSQNSYTPQLRGNSVFTIWMFQTCMFLCRKKHFFKIFYFVLHRRTIHTGLEWHESE